jgi:hypothetical protein
MGFSHIGRPCDAASRHLQFSSTYDVVDDPEITCFRMNVCPRYPKSHARSFERAARGFLSTVTAGDVVTQTFKKPQLPLTVFSVNVTALFSRLRQ